jgi:hypothetical protein
VIRRLFWLSMGATIGVLVVRKLTRTARAFTPTGVATRVGGSVGGAVGNLSEAIRDFAADVRDAMVQREQELRESMSLDGRVGARPEDF